MNKQDFSNPLADLRYLTLFPRRYREAVKHSADYWRAEIRRYANTEKRIECTDYQWYVLEFKDGHKELARLRVLQGGLFSGYAPAIYRGLVIPRRIGFVTFAHIENIRLAF